MTEDLMAGVFISLQGQVAIVTGARRGIGRAIAQALAEAGSGVCVCDVVSQGRLDNVAKEISGLGRPCLALEADVSRKRDVDGMVQRVMAEFGKIDVLVNCAGVWVPGQTLVECDESDWDRVMNTNLKGALLCCQAAGVEMIKAGRGSIVNIASDLGIDPIPAIGAYGISKAGLITLTRQLALELGKSGIRVNAVAPGMVKTDMNVQIRGTPETERAIEARVVLGRLGEPGDIAKTVLYLSSSLAEHVTGQTMIVNGGGFAPAGH
jgi:NAD(P)-dependent dehydrogenase (short-subunit alcohol dehydrogenase family)